MLWKGFTTVVMLNEQMRAAGDPYLERLLMRIRVRGAALLSRTCYLQGKARWRNIPISGIRLCRLCIQSLRDPVNASMFQFWVIVLSQQVRICVTLDRFYD
jgi:hypothetical protein